MKDTQFPGLGRDALLPRPPEGMGRGLALAAAAHGLLIAGLAFNINWSSSEPAGVEAELWAAVPQIAAQRVEAVEPEAEEPPPKPRPVEKPVEAPPPPPKAQPQPDADIALEKEKARKEKLKEDKLREDKLREEKAKEKEKEKDRLDKLAQQKREADEKKKADDKKLADKKKEDAAQQAALDKQREAQLKRILAQAGADKGSPGGTAAQTAGASSSYGGRIVAAVMPNITLTTDLNGNPAAEVEVRQAPDGTITGSRLIKSSGVKEWDDAVLLAIDKTRKLPRDIDGRVISPIIITFKPR